MKKIQKKSECWNGATCQYYKKGKCHFYHPQHHIPQQLENNLKNPITSWYFKRSQHFKYFSSYKGKDCAICLQQFKTGKNITKLYCNHFFHYDCIQQWFANSVVCPLCKQDFRKYQKYQQFKDFKPIKEEKFYSSLNQFQIDIQDFQETDEYFFQDEIHPNLDWDQDLSYDEQYYGESQSDENQLIIHNIQQPNQQSAHHISISLSVSIQQYDDCVDEDSIQQVQLW